MKKVKIVFTGVYVKFTPATETTSATRKVLYNYVVVDGDIAQYSADKEASGHLSLQDTGEYTDAPRYVSRKNLQQENELTRIQKKDGTFDWYTDDIEAMLMSSEVNEMSDAGKQAHGQKEVADATARVKATAKLHRDLKAKEFADAELFKKQNPDLKES